MEHFVFNFINSQLTFFCLREYCLFSLARQMKCEVTSKYILNFARQNFFSHLRHASQRALGGSSSYIFLENVLFFWPAVGGEKFESIIVAADPAGGSS